MKSITNTKGSMTLFSLSFLFLFISWVHVNLEIHVKGIQALEDISTINSRIDLEADVFDLVLQGYETGWIIGKAKYEVKETILYVYVLGDSPYTLEYDIIEDESFGWRKKYDSIE